MTLRLVDFRVRDWKGSRDSEGQPSHGMAHYPCDCEIWRPATTAELAEALAAELAEGQK